MTDLAPDPREMALQEQREAARRQAEAAARIVWSISVNDQGPWTLRLGELSAADYGAIRRGPGLALDSIMRGALTRDLEATAALVWLARRQCGEVDLSWPAVEQGIRMSDVILLDVGEHEEGADGELPDPPA